MQHLLAHIEPFDNNRKVIAYNQNVTDIITGILATHKRYVKDYDNICLSFWKGSTDETCKNIYNWLKANTHYVIEPDSKQTLRSPAAIMILGAKKNVGLDCKSYALFIGGILDALKRKGKNINWCYRFASYKPENKIPHHVFIVVNPGKEEIWVDPVINRYNYHKPYYYKTDRSMLVSLSGIGRTKKKGKGKLRKFLQKGGKAFIKLNPATTIARNSFLALTKLNVLNLAKKLMLLYQKTPDKLLNMWGKIGGNKNSLLKAISVGAKKGKDSNKQAMQGVGVVAIASAIATATPIIIAIKKLLNEAGIDNKKLTEAAGAVVRSIAQKKIEESDQEANEDSLEDFVEENNVNPVNDSGSEEDNIDTGVDDSSVTGFLPRDNKFRGTRNYNDLFNYLK